MPKAQTENKKSQSAMPNSRAEARKAWAEASEALFFCISGQNMNKNINRINNFDLIKLLAALQVVNMHSKNHLKIHGTVATYYDNFLQYFPGVPIFFTVSGFLIFWGV